MVGLLNFIILVTIIITFATLIAGLVYTARSGDNKGKINSFMKYRVYFQAVAILILIISIYLKKQIVG
jgi:hypothetical protein